MQYLQLTLVIMCLQAQQLLDQPDPAALRNKQLVEGIARTLGAYPIRVQPAIGLCFSIVSLCRLMKPMPDGLSAPSCW